MTYKELGFSLLSPVLFGAKEKNASITSYNVIEVKTVLIGTDYDLRSKYEFVALQM
jgi:hypothetical protein